jgi:hypothetical protein
MGLFKSGKRGATRNSRELGKGGMGKVYKVFDQEVQATPCSHGKRSVFS